MNDAARYKALQAQQYLAIADLRAVTESLVATIAHARPRSPLRALVQAVEQMERVAAEAPGNADGAAAAAAQTAIAASAAAPVTPHFVLLMGPPGAGKSVQSAHVATTLHGVHCAVPALVRDALNGGRLPGSKVVYVPLALQGEVRAAKAAASQQLQSASATAGAAASGAPFSTSLPADLATRLVVNRVQYELQQQPAVPSVLFVLDGFPSSIAEAVALEAAAGQPVALAVALRCPDATLQSRRCGGGAAVPGRLGALATLEEYWKAQHTLRTVDGSKSVAAVTREVLTLLQEV